MTQFEVINIQLSSVWLRKQPLTVKRSLRKFPLSTFGNFQHFPIYKEYESNKKSKTKKTPTRIVLETKKNPLTTLIF